MATLKRKVLFLIFCPLLITYCVTAAVGWMPALVIAGLAGCRSITRRGPIERPDAWTFPLALAYVSVVFGMLLMAIEGRYGWAFFWACVCVQLWSMTWPGPERDA